MESKRTIMILMGVGSFVGSYVPTIWGAGYFSMASVLWTAIGGIAGIWLGLKLTR